MSGPANSSRTQSLARWLPRPVLEYRTAFKRSAQLRRIDARNAVDEALRRRLLIQAKDEIDSLLALLQSNPPRVVLEIGSAYGGSLFLWTRVASDDALLIAVDSKQHGILGRWSAESVMFRRTRRVDQRVELVFGAPSQRPETRERVVNLLGGRPVDFLFIDGDHSYDGVRGDYELYGPLVRPGGIIALHDVAPRIDAGTGVPRFWSELKSESDTQEFVAREEPSFGIGVLRPGRQ